MRYFELALVLGSLLITSGIVPAFAQSTEWDKGNITTFDDDGVRISDVEHNGNLVINDIDVPYVYVLYEDALPFTYSEYVEMDVAKLDSFSTTNPQSGETKFEGKYYFGTGQTCNAASWGDIANCYQLRTQYILDDAGIGSPSAPPKLKPAFKTAGTLFVADDGYPDYIPRIRIDIDVANTNPGGTGEDYIREKNSDGTWTTKSIEEIDMANVDSGQAYRVHDDNVGWMESIGIDPEPLADFVILEYHSGQDDCALGSSCESGFETNEGIDPAHIVVWYRPDREATSTSCVPGAVCTLQVVIIPNNL